MTRRIALLALVAALVAPAATAQARILTWYGPRLQARTCVRAELVGGRIVDGVRVGGVLVDVRVTCPVREERCRWYVPNARPTQRPRPLGCVFLTLRRGGDPLP